jgi:alpha-beta hydrolase superfamily lysophospholipase
MTTTPVLGTAGQELYYRSWRPTATPRAVVAIVPGFNSHSGYYDWVGEQLVGRGLAAYAVDLRGRGKSDGERFYVERFDDYVNDAHAFVTMVREREPGLPVFLLGHSAGGVVACLYAIEHQADLAGLICESFAFKVPAPDIALAVLKGVAHVAQHFHVLKLKNEDFSRDPAVVQRMNSDPLIAGESQPSQTIAEMVRADARLEGSFGQITLPLLILHGTHDKAAKYEGSQQFYRAAGSADKTLDLYEGAYHDLLNDTDREKVMGDILAWIEARVNR